MHPFTPLHPFHVVFITFFFSSLPNHNSITNLSNKPIAPLYLLHTSSSCLHLFHLLVSFTPLSSLLLFSASETHIRHSFLTFLSHSHLHLFNLPVSFAPFHLSLPLSFFLITPTPFSRYQHHIRTSFLTPFYLPHLSLSQTHLFSLYLLLLFSLRPSHLFHRLFCHCNITTAPQKHNRCTHLTYLSTSHLLLFISAPLPHYYRFF